MQPSPTSTDPTVGGGSENRALTGLRGVAATLVMLHHFFLHRHLQHHLPELQNLLQKGYLGVDLFFVLSGFVMALTYGTWFGPRGATVLPYLRFMIRRVARVWPLHVVVVVLLVLIGWPPAHMVVTPRLLLSNLLMVQAWGFSAEINPPAWSISTEMVAYLAFPLLVALVLRGGRMGPLVALAAACAALLLCMEYAPPLGAMRRGQLDIYFNYSLLPTLRCLAGFTCGMLAWRLGELRPVQRLAGRAWFAPACLLLVIGLMLGQINDLLIYPLLPLLVLGTFHGTGPMQRAFGRGPIRTLGLLSYAIYLVHFALVVHFPFGAGPVWLMLPLFLCTTMLLAAAAHLAIELPGRRTLRQAGDRSLAALVALFRPA